VVALSLKSFAKGACYKLGWNVHGQKLYETMIDDLYIKKKIEKQLPYMRL